MHRFVRGCARRYLNDWGLDDLLKLTPDLPYIRFDKERALRDICDNILENAYPGGGTQLDLSFKQAFLSLNAFAALQKMWGPPTRIIYTLREPESYMASAVQKFPNSPLTHLQQSYVSNLKNYEKLGGDIFEFGPEVTAEDYRTFLKPLRLPDKMEAVEYKGRLAPEHVTAEMREGYAAFKAAHTIHPEAPATASFDALR
ncbi:MAG: hypothetical protein QOD99_1664 [Chthoniobacter sp.]|nr:hypothetical protein [Chthoniobacter sp.]